MENYFWFTFVVIFGALIGSFLSVCIYRIPLGREDCQPEGQPLPEKPISIGYPVRSFCPHCKKQLRWFHNIPVLSWLALRGRCGFCSAKISFRYPLVELLSAGFAGLSFYQYGLTPTAAVVYFTCATLIVLSFIDYDFYILPNVITLPGIIFGLVLSVVSEFTNWFTAPVTSGMVYSLLGILAGGGFLYLISEVYFRLRKVEGLGMGDVKLLAAVGAIFGPEAALYTIFIGSLFGSILGLLLILVAGRKMSQHLPFGPYLALATVLYLFTGLVIPMFLGDGINHIVKLFL